MLMLTRMQCSYYCPCDRKALASEYTRPYFIESEDDVLHVWELPDFGELDVGHTKAPDGQLLHRRVAADQSAR